MTPLHAASQRGSSEVVEYLMAQGAVSRIGPDSVTPLHLSTAPTVVSLLCSGGAGVSARDHWGATPLHYAVWTDQTEVARQLLLEGANPNAQDCVGATPLHYAAIRGNTGVVVALLAHRADRRIKTLAGESPCDWVGQRSLSVVAWMQRFGKRSQSTVELGPRDRQRLCDVLGL